MLTADILTMDMHSVHGANKVTEKLIQGREIFEENGIHLRYVVSQDGIIDCWNYKKSTLGQGLESTNYKIRRMIIESLKRLPIYKSYFIQKKLVEKLYNGNEKVVKYYVGAQESNGIVIHQRADVVIFQDPFTAQYYLEKTLDYNKSIFISHAAEDPLEQLLLSRQSLLNTEYEKILRNKFHFMAEHVNKIVTICKTAQKYNKEVYNLDCPCVMNGIEDVEYIPVPKLSKTDGKIHIAIVASVQYRKGQDLAIEALSRLNSEERNRIFLDIMGNGNKFQEYKTKVEQLGLSNNVKFYGAVLDIENKLPQVDVFLLPSRADTVPIAILEALRAGLPVFATNVGEIPEMISECGELIETNVNSIETLYKNLINNYYDLLLLGQKSREKFVKEYQLSQMIQKYADILSSL